MPTLIHPDTGVLVEVDPVKATDLGWPGADTAGQPHQAQAQAPEPAPGPPPKRARKKPAARETW